MATTFERDLDSLKKVLLSMGARVEANITRAVNALVDRRVELVASVIEGDREIDALEVEIDELCHRILALHQPVATDLRFILAVTKVNNELERMGDHARNIARRAAELGKGAPIGVYADLTAMADASLSLVNRALESLVKRDIALAGQVWDDDDQVDAIYKHIVSELVASMQTDPQRVPQALSAMRAAGDLERIGDIATNIAKDVIFLVKGEIVAHRHLRS